MGVNWTLPQWQPFWFSLFEERQLIVSLFIAWKLNSVSRLTPFECNSTSPTLMAPPNPPVRPHLKDLEAGVRTCPWKRGIIRSYITFGHRTGLGQSMSGVSDVNWSQSDVFVEIYKSDVFVEIINLMFKWRFINLMF